VAVSALAGHIPAAARSAVLAALVSAVGEWFLERIAKPPEDLKHEGGHRVAWWPPRFGAGG
jgi:hypothetical protein